MVDEEMDFWEYIDVVMRRKWVVVGISLIILISGGITSLCLPDVYEAEVSLLIIPPQLSQRGRFPYEVFEAMLYKEDVKVNIVPKSEVQGWVIYIAKQGRNPEKVARLANELADDLIEKAKLVLSNISEEEIKAVLIRKAIVPGLPIKPDRKRNVLIAGVLGLFVGIFVAFLYDSYERRKNGRAKGGT